MNRSIVLFVSMIVFSLFAFSSRAAFADPCSGNLCARTTVKKLYLSSSDGGVVYIEPAGGGQANLSCTPVEGVYLTLRKTHPMFEAIYTALLSAALADQPVTLRISTGSATCDLSYITVNN